MKKLFISGLVITGLILAAPGISSAGQHQGGKCVKCAEQAKTCKVTLLKNKVKLLWENKEELGLKDDQLSKIKDIKHQAVKELIQLKADVDIITVDLDSAKYEDTWDVEAINKLVDVKYEAKKATAKTFVKAVGDIQQVLSKDQRVEWQKLCKKPKECKFCPLTGKPKDK